MRGWMYLSNIFLHNSSVYAPSNIIQQKGKQTININKNVGGF